MADGPAAHYECSERERKIFLRKRNVFFFFDFVNCDVKQNVCFRVFVYRKVSPATRPLQKKREES